MVSLLLVVLFDENCRAVLMAVLIGRSRLPHLLLSKKKKASMISLRFQFLLLFIISFRLWGLTVVSVVCALGPRRKEAATEDDDTLLSLWHCFCMNI